MKWIKRIGIILGAFLLIAGIAGWIIANIYEEEVKKFLVKKVESKLETEVKVGALNLSLWDKFPAASLTFSEVVVYERTFSDIPPDTLAYLDNVFFQFDISDLFQGNYVIRKITAETGFLHASIDEKGRDNFRVWKTDTSDAANFLIELEDVELEEIRFRHRNEFKGQLVHLFVNNLHFQGAFSRDKYTMQVRAGTDLEIFKSEDAIYGENNRLEIAANIEIDRVNEEYIFSNGNLNIDEIMDFAISGKIYAAGTDLQIQGKNLPILSVKNLLPDQWRNYIDPYESRGVLDLKADIVRAFSRSSDPTVSLQYGIKNGMIRHKSSGLELNGMYLEGTFTNGKNQNRSSSVLDISSLKAHLGSGSIDGQLKVSNFNKPYTDTEWSFQLSLPELLTFFEVQDIHKPKGSFEGVLAYAGVWEKKGEISRKELDSYRTSGAFFLKDISFNWSDYPIRFNDLNGELDFVNRDLLAKELSGKWGSDQFKLEGRAQGFLYWLFLEDQTLDLYGNIEGGVIDLNKVIEDHRPTEEDEKGFSLPERVRITARAKMEGLKYEKFAMSNLSAKILLDAGELRAENIQLDAVEGKIGGLLSLKTGEGMGFGLAITAQLDDLDIKQLFEQFDNFGQQTLRSEHLVGRTTAKIDLYTLLDPFFNIQTHKIKMDADLEIRDGELIGLEAMDEIAENIRENKILGLFIKVDPLAEDLSHIQFSTIKNTLKIRNSILFIPKMNIRSTAVDIALDGRHTFKNEIDYHLSFSLAEVLSTKTRRSKQEFDYIEDEHDGRTRVFMAMKGTVDDPIISFERMKIGTSFLKKGFEKEKNTVKSILKEELGLFKNDTTIPEKEPEAIVEAVTAIEWEEAEGATQTQKKADENPTEKATDNKKGIKKFFGKPKKKKDPIDSGEWEADDDDY